MNKNSDEFNHYGSKENYSNKKGDAVNEDEKRIFNNNFVSENTISLTKISSINKYDLRKILLKFYIIFSFF